jgi:hypothetical protein
MFVPKTFRLFWQILLFTTFLFIQQQPIHAQSYNDSSFRKNVVKFDISSGILYNNAFNFTFERVIKKNQTLSLTLGNEQLPTLVSIFGNEDSAMNISRKTASGYKIGLDYRFYLAKENKYRGPHGVYIGPYLAYHNFKNDWNLSIKGNSGPQTGVANGKFQVFNAGFQAGYQFLINNRWSIDMSFIGASVSHYRAKMDVTGNFDIDDVEIEQAILDKIIDRFPLIGDLMDDGKVDQSGINNKWALGVRYMAHVGYAFGGSPKKVTKPTQ